MGCDIHAHVEIKYAGNWMHYANPRINRWYDLFSLMANVRNEEIGHAGYIRPIAQPRGIPRDATPTTKLCAKEYGADGHSHSWLSSEEVAKVVEWANKNHYKENSWYSFEHSEIGYIFGNGWNFKNYPAAENGKGYDGQPHKLEDARLVFWFDN